MNTLNVWIERSGTARPVAKAGHAAAYRPKADVARVSTPEGRRTWLGIECVAPLTDAARDTLRRTVRDARKAGYAIIADMGNGRHVECWPSDRPTELNRAIAQH